MVYTFKWYIKYHYNYEINYKYNKLMLLKLVGSESNYIVLKPGISLYLKYCSMILWYHNT